MFTCGNCGSELLTSSNYLLYCANCIVNNFISSCECEVNKAMPTVAGVLSIPYRSGSDWANNASRTTIELLYLRLPVAGARFVSVDDGSSRQWVGLDNGATIKLT